MLVTCVVCKEPVFVSSASLSAGEALMACVRCGANLVIRSNGRVRQAEADADTQADTASTAGPATTAEAIEQATAPSSPIAVTHGDATLGALAESGTVTLAQLEAASGGADRGAAIGELEPLDINLPSAADAEPAATIGDGSQQEPAAEVAHVPTLQVQAEWVAGPPSLLGTGPIPIAIPPLGVPQALPAPAPIPSSALAPEAWGVAALGAPPAAPQPSLDTAAVATTIAPQPPPPAWTSVSPGQAPASAPYPLPQEPLQPQPFTQSTPTTPAAVAAPPAAGGAFTAAVAETPPTAAAAPSQPLPLPPPSLQAAAETAQAAAAPQYEADDLEFVDLSPDQDVGEPELDTAVFAPLASAGPSVPLQTSTLAEYEPPPPGAPPPSTAAALPQPALASTRPMFAHGLEPSASAVAPVVAQGSPPPKQGTAQQTVAQVAESTFAASPAPEAAPPQPTDVASPVPAPAEAAPPAQAAPTGNGIPAAPAAPNEVTAPPPTVATAAAPPHAAPPHAAAPPRSPLAPPTPPQASQREPGPGQRPMPAQTAPRPPTRGRRRGAAASQRSAAWWLGGAGVIAGLVIVAGVVANGHDGPDGERPAPATAEAERAAQAAAQLGLQPDLSSTAPDFVPALASPKDAAQALYRKANLLIRDKKLDDAVAALEQCVELDPTFGLAFRSLGITYMMQGFERKALVAYSKFVRLSPDHEDVPQVRKILRQRRRMLSDE